MNREHAVRGVRIYVNGAVEAYTYSKTTPEKTQGLAVLEASVVAHLKAEVNAIEAAELIDEDAGKPMCMDAGTTTYLVHKSNGLEQKIAQTVNCHNNSLENGQGQDIKNLLSAFENLAR
jgi:hypothetical protein